MLAEARRLGFLGPGPVADHLGHAEGFGVAIEAVPGGTPPRRAADLGSGGGVPGLPLALRFAGCQWTLIEAGRRRAAFLRDAVEQLALTSRVRVIEERAEAVGRMPDMRGAFDLVVARGFGPPAVVAECGAPLLRVGGWAVVSEPPGGEPARWSTAGLADVGMEPGPPVQAGGAAYQLLGQVASCPERYPRRIGVPGKRPLF